jgi:hypothetical protein
MTTPEEPPPADMPTDLPWVLTPARAAELLRTAGLEDITECALRTRAYRKQIPFHRNGHRARHDTVPLLDQALVVQPGSSNAKPPKKSLPSSGRGYRYRSAASRETGNRGVVPQCVPHEAEG